MIEYIIGLLVIVIGALGIALKVAIAEKKGLSEENNRLVESEKQAKETIDEQRKQNIALKTAQINQNERHKYEQARIDKGARDAFETDTF